MVEDISREELKAKMERGEVFVLLEALIGRASCRERVCLYV